MLLLKWGGAFRLKLTKIFFLVSSSSPSFFFFLLSYFWYFHERVYILLLSIITTPSFKFLPFTALQISLTTFCAWICWVYSTHLTHYFNIKHFNLIILHYSHGKIHSKYHRKVILCQCFAIKAYSYAITQFNLQSHLPIHRLHDVVLS